MSDSVQRDFTLIAPVQAASSASGIPFWGEDPDAWDKIIIRRTVLPGTCELRGKGFSQRLDKKRSVGRNGHAPTHLGIECAQIEITIRLWEDEHLQAFAQLVPLLKPRAKTQKTVNRYAEPEMARQFRFMGKRTHQGVASFKSLSESLQRHQKATVTEGGPTPVPIYHPALALFKIRSVIIESCSLPEPEHGGGNGVYVVHLKCEEFMSGAARFGNVTTAKHAPDLRDLGPGAIPKILKKPTPADNNTGP